MSSSADPGGFLLSLLYGLIAGVAISVILRWPRRWPGFVVVLILIPVAFYVGVSTHLIDFFGYRLRVDYMLASFLVGLGLAFLWRAVFKKRQ